MTTRRLLKRFLIMMVCLVGLLGSKTAMASHFRYGTISWTVPDPQNAPLTVEFTVITAWRALAVDGTDLNFGDGFTNGYVVGATTGTGIDTLGEAYVVTEYTATHTYAAAGDFVAFFESCCRIGSLQNGANNNFRVETFVSLVAGNTGGPVSASTAIIQMQVGNVRTYVFPAFDPDGDPVTCRLATDAEVGFPGSVPSANGQQPTVAMGPGGCEVTWDLTGAAAGQQHVLHIVLESIHGGSVSSTALDLIVETVLPPPPDCTGEGTFIANVGVPLSVQTTGTQQGGGNLDVSAIGMPATATLAPLTGASPLTTTFDWTAAASDAGTTKVVLVNYTNGQNSTGTCALTIQVPQCVGYGNPCSAGIGECLSSGIIVCAGPNLPVCNAVAGSPSAEVCDGLDNDCDGTDDNGNPGSGAACSSGEPGVCDAGLTNCTAGVLECDPTILPGTQTETCNTLDDDCDGSADEDFNLGTACSNGVGECAASGVIVCDGGGGAVCDAVPGSPTSEICDGLDNDCDGTDDNGNPGSGAACSSGEPGVCDPGLTNCNAGAIECVPTIAPGSQTETCNALDDDCDGSADEDFNLGTACSNGVGECAASGVIVCDGGGGAVCDAVPGSPAAELCDGLDNDCDGTNDNGNPGSGAACSSGEPGVCDPGLTSCSSGAIVCVPTIAPGSQAETCNTLDDDCDGSADEDFNLGDACTSGLGICEAAGALVCDSNGAAICDAVEGTPEAEQCGDSIDSDCDGDPNNGCTDSDGDGLTDNYEDQIGTDPNDADSDDDGVPDGDEINPAEDTDGDGLINALDSDSDNDGLFDGTEMGYDCSDPDTDSTVGNCVPDGDEGATTTDPLDSDTDDGGVSDGSEDINGNGVIDAGETDPNDPSDDVGIVDTDGDGLGDDFEIAIGTDPNDADSDDDGVIDGLEPNPTGDSDGDGVINALDPDSDDDGLFDGTEMGFDCSSPDTDVTVGNCIPDGDEGATTTSPLDPDTDDGSVLDGVEDANHNGVVDEGETDPNDPSDDLNCQVDSDCGEPDSGQVCNAQGECIEGCRGEGGNGCPATELCTSTDATIGDCVPTGEGGSGGGTVPSEEDPSGLSVEGGGCRCALPASDDHDDGRGYLSLLALGAALSLRRRRDRL